MNNVNKGKSPFYPGQPVPIEFFVGRSAEINQIIRAIGQVELGKPQAIFLTGEYGIGKSSLANFMRFVAEQNNHLLGIHVFLGGAQLVEDVAIKTVETIIKIQAYTPTTSEKIRNHLARYVGKQDLFGFSVNLEVLKADSPNLSNGFLPFLRDLLDRVKESDIKGIMLVLDEINGITKNPQFAHFIKGLVDENALSPEPLPLLLMLCGVEDRRRDMIQHHQPIERIFEIVEIKPMDIKEMEDFFNKAFKSINMEVEEKAMTSLCRYSDGFPKVMHMIGENIFWIDQDNVINYDDAMLGIIMSAEDIGKKFVDHQVYKALRSKDYHSILAKLGKSKFDLSFMKSEIAKGLSDIEKKKFNNFLQRMKKLNVVKSGDGQGEYGFNSRMVRLYIRLNSIQPISLQSE